MAEETQEFNDGEEIRNMPHNLSEISLGDLVRDLFRLEISRLTLELSIKDSKKDYRSKPELSLKVDKIYNNPNNQSIISCRDDLIKEIYQELNWREEEYRTR